jgi:hypothetical protein
VSDYPRHALYFEADYAATTPSEKDRNGLYNAELYVMPWRRPHFGEEELLATLRSIFESSMIAPPTKSTTLAISPVLSWRTR